MNERDQVFIRFAGWLIGLLAIYLVGTFIVVLAGDHALALRLVGGASAMFAGILGLGTGYLIGTAGKGESGKPRRKSTKV